MFGKYVNWNGLYRVIQNSRYSKSNEHRLSSETQIVFSFVFLIEKLAQQGVRSRRGIWITLYDMMKNGLWMERNDFDATLSESIFQQIIWVICRFRMTFSSQFTNFSWPQPHTHTWSIVTLKSLNNYSIFSNYSHFSFQMSRLNVQHSNLQQRCLYIVFHPNIVNL